jgi:thioredoxin reductase
MTRQFDLIVIGTGSAASAVASRCRRAGRQVAVVDSRPFGGTCALRGCDPKKVLVGAAEVIDWDRRMQGKGIDAEQTRIVWPELMRFKRTFTEPVPSQTEEWMTKSGIVTVHGRAHFVGPGAIKVEDDVLEAANVVVAAGAKPVDLNIPGAEHLVTSEQFLELDNLPERIVFIGGGYISFEFAHVAARANIQATILHRGERPLNRFDPDLVNRLVTRTRDIGVDVQVRVEVTSISASATGFKVRALAEGRECDFEANLVVHGAGRVPEIDDMDLAKVAVSPPLNPIRRKGLLEIIKAVLILLMLFSPAITWSQTQVTDQSNRLEYAQQSPISQSNLAPAPSTDSGTVLLPDQAPAPQTNRDDSEGQQTKRMFWLVPNFAAVSAHTQLRPLSTREKFVLAAQDSVLDYSSFTWTGILAAQAMVLNSDPELGRGIAGYRRYYWRTFTDGVSGTFFTEAIVPAITHEDPRYYTMGQGGFLRRMGYAISRAFVTKTDSGGTSFNASEVVGNALEAGLSTAYYPPQERGLGQTALNFGTQMESAVLNHIFQEFWPDIRKKILRQR